MAPSDGAPFSLRRLLRSLVFGAAAFASGIPPATAMQGPEVLPTDAVRGAGSNAPVRPFRLDQVRLGDGLLQEKRDRIKRFLLEYDERRFMVLFNKQAGRPAPEGVSVPGGWEDGGLLS